MNFSKADLDSVAQVEIELATVILNNFDNGVHPEILTMAVDRINLRIRTANKAMEEKT